MRWWEDGDLIGAIVFGVATPLFFALFYFRAEWANHVYREFPLFGRRLSPKTWRIIAYIILIAGVYQVDDFLMRYFSN